MQTDKFQGDSYMKSVKYILILVVINQFIANSALITMALFSYKMKENLDKKEKLFYSNNNLINLL